MSTRRKPELVQLRRLLVLDLDFTLLHLEAVPDAVEVPGRTRSSYLAAGTAEALADLQERFDILLATARSWCGTRPVVEGLAKYGVTVSNLVLEDGSSLLGTPKEVRPLEPNRYWEPLRAALAGTTMRGCPPFEWHEEFRACLVALNASPAEAEEVRVRLGGEALRRDSTLRVFRDGRKVYIAGSRADKWTALQALLGEKAGDAVGVGDGANDLCWLSRVQRPCTLLDAAPEVVGLVEEKSGLVSTETGHEGILGLLRELAL